MKHKIVYTLIIRPRGYGWKARVLSFIAYFLGVNVDWDWETKEV